MRERERCNRPWLWILVVGLVGSSAPPIAAASPDGTGFEAGVRLGYGIPFGKVTGGADDDLNEGIEGMIPLAVDLGYRVIPQVFVGVYGQYGFGFVGDTISSPCDASSMVDCGASNIRLGIQGHYHAKPGEQFDPWIGLGFGYEWLTLSIEGGGIEATITPSGFEFLQLQVGLDIAVAEQFYVGPFLTFSIGQYDSVSTDCPSAAASVCGMLDGDIEDKTLHEWLILGVRGHYGP